MMNAKGKLKTIEKAMGVDQPCRVCLARENYDFQINKFYEKHKIKTDNQSPKSNDSLIVIETCHFCLRTSKKSFDYGQEFKEWYLKILAASEKGLAHAPENRYLFEKQAFENNDSGEGIPEKLQVEYQKLKEKLMRNIWKARASVKPKIPFCRVENCPCGIK